jgi:hypothetical protein
MSLLLSADPGTRWTRTVELPPLPLYLPVGTVVVATRCLCCCLRILEPGGLELLNLGLLGRHLMH